MIVQDFFFFLPNIDLLLDQLINLFSKSSSIQEINLKWLRCLFSNFYLIQLSITLLQFKNVYLYCDDVVFDFSDFNLFLFVI